METIWGWIDKFNCAGDRYTIKLPNVQKADPGTAYFLNMDTREHIGYIRTLVLSILMQYPAGRMDLAMIDPRMSGCFMGLEALGEWDKSMIDVQIWKEDPDIDSALSGLEEKLSKMTDQYGSAADECLEKEKRSLVAIADFPRGFSEEALERLAALVEGGTRYGFSFVIAQSHEEMEAKEDSPEFGQMIGHMLKMMRVLTSEDGRICYHATWGGQECVWHHTMDTAAILDHDSDIIHEIGRCLSEKNQSGDQ